jgi:hypothetical protein
MNYSEFNINQAIRCIECGLPSDNHNVYHIFNGGNLERLNVGNKK